MSDSIGRTKKTVDLTQGNILKEIIVFALPMLAGEILLNLYSSVDAITVGRFCGFRQLAAIESSADIINFIISFSSGLSVGGGILISRYFGARNYEKVSDMLHTALAFAFAFGAIVAGASIILTPNILRGIVRCPEDILPQATLYLRIYFIGYFFECPYTMAAQIMRSMGNSASPFKYSVIAGAVNVVLDCFAVIVLDWGVAGVAVATVASQIITFVCAMVHMTRSRDEYHVEIRKLKINWKDLWEIMTFGLPLALQHTLVSFSNMFIQRYINRFDDPAMLAGIGAAKKVDKFVGLVVSKLAQALATFIGQNLGAGKKDRIRTGLKRTLFLSLSYAVAAGGLLFAFAPAVIGLFTTDTGSIGYGVGMMRTMMPAYSIFALYNILTFSCRAFNKSSIVTLCAFIGMVICRQSYLAIGFSIVEKISLVYFAWPVGWLASTLMVFVFFMRVVRPQIRRTGQEIQP